MGKRLGVNHSALWPNYRPNRRSVSCVSAVSTRSPAGLPSAKRSVPLSTCHWPGNLFLDTQMFAARFHVSKFPTCTTWPYQGRWIGSSIKRPILATNVTAITTASSPDFRFPFPMVSLPEHSSKRGVFRGSETAYRLGSQRPLAASCFVRARRRDAKRPF
jgi:hypothetical protein